MNGAKRSVSTEASGSSRVSVRFVECWKAMPHELATLARSHGLKIIRCSKPGMVCFTFLAAHGPRAAWEALDGDMTKRGWEWAKRDPLGKASFGMTVSEARRIPRSEWADSPNTDHKVLGIDKN